MAFLPERNYKEQTLANSYNLTNGITAFTSDSVVEFNKISFQINTTGLAGDTSFRLEQSSDNSKWTPLSEDTYILPLGSGSLVIQKNDFTGKYVRVNLIDTGSGTLSIFLVAKR